jgi:prolyl-tRNA editing enzyme YbaK/EbsC (Cys-tRNA(Pro) deacylase)
VRGHEIKAAAPDRTSQLSEYLSEAVPPAGLPKGFRVVVDRALAGHEVLYFAGGEATAILKIRGDDLVKATAAKVAGIARPVGDDRAGRRRGSRPRS